MTPDGIAATNRRIGIMLEERKLAFARAARDTLEQFGARNTIHSSMYVIAVHRICSEELDARAQLAWRVIRSVIDAEGWHPADDNVQQTEDMLREGLSTGSADVDEAYAKACSMIQGNWPTLEAPRAQALQKAFADAEIDRLGRRSRHLPLLDALTAPRYVAAHAQWKKAFDKASATPPDYPNATKEAVSAVESLAQVVLGKTGLTLGDAVKELRSRKTLPVGADKVLDGLWAFSNATPGTRHGGTVPPSADESDWEFARQVAEAGTRMLLHVDAG